MLSYRCLVFVCIAQHLHGGPKTNDSNTEVSEMICSLLGALSHVLWVGVRVTVLHAMTKVPWRDILQGRSFIPWARQALSVTSEMA